MLMVLSKTTNAHLATCPSVLNRLCCTYLLSFLGPAGGRRRARRVQRDLRTGDNARNSTPDGARLETCRIQWNLSGKKMAVKEQTLYERYKVSKEKGVIVLSLV